MARFDLNLLSALNALLTEKNVTRAAEWLNVTQPTMSGMLQRLRYQFDDPLLVRNGRELELTPFGASLVQPVREALRSVELLIRTEPTFDPATSNRDFMIMASDYCASVFLPKVVAHLATDAPGLRLIIQPINTPIERVFSGEVDLCITADDMSLFSDYSGVEKVQSEHLFSDEFVCVVAADHPLTERSSLEQLFSFPHVGVQMTGTLNTLESAWTQKHRPGYKPSVVVADFSLVACMVAQSRLVGLIQSKMADLASALPIRIFRPPFKLAALNEAMIWHSRYTQDPAHLWFRGLLRQTAATWHGSDVAYAHPTPSLEDVLKRRPATMFPIG